MAKAYWVAIYRSTPNPEAHAAYVKLAVPALTAHGAHFLARGTPAQTYEAGHKERQSGHYATEFQCPLLGVKRTWGNRIFHKAALGPAAGLR